MRENTQRTSRAGADRLTIDAAALAAAFFCGFASAKACGRGVPDKGYGK